jgi:hypothetical protein
MKVTAENTMKYRMLKRLESLSSRVILRKDFTDLGSQQQITRGLNQLIIDKKLARIGYGVYAKAKESPYTGKTVVEFGTSVVFREALDRLGVKWDWNWAEKEYASRQSTQIPVIPMVRLKSRFRRHLSFNDSTLLFEDRINAR